MAVAERVGKPVGDVQALLDLRTMTTSLDTLMQNDPSSSLAELIPDDQRMGQDEQLAREEIHYWVHACLDQLNERHRDVLQRRFGLNGLESHTLDQLAEHLRLSRERVRRIQTDALRALQRILQNQGLEQIAIL